MSPVCGSLGSVGTLTSLRVATTTSWTKIVYTFTVPTFSGKTFGANSCLGVNISTALQANSVYTLDIAQVQLEEGSVATPFEVRPIGLELALCQRYAQILTTNTVSDYDLRPSMRVSPTKTAVTGGYLYAAEY